MNLPEFDGKAFLAPMSGISDPAFRLLCREQGAAMVVTELTNVHAIVEKEKQLAKNGRKIKDFIEYNDLESPVGVQLFGNDIDKVIKAAKIVEPFFDFIDFNMGCPAPHITSQMAGAALLQKKEFNQELFSRLVKAVDKPITLKMRTGPNYSDCFAFKEVARTAVEAGVQMLTLHGRSVKQGYSGKADWDKIKELKEMVDVPVVGNGDIVSPEKAKEMMDYTGCDYVMVGRGARGNPNLFKDINNYLDKGSYEKTNTEEKLYFAKKYLEYSKNYNIKFSNKRMQVMQFTKGLEGGSTLRLNIGRAKDEKELYEIIENNLVVKNSNKI